MQMFVTIIIFVLLLSFLVLIHELGHFIVAKLTKIKVEEFGLGYPPRALTLFKKWGTIFSLNWIPFGGFVKMEGEDGGETSQTHVTHKKGEGPFYEKTILARMAVILAGASVNFIFGVLAFSVVFSFWGIPSGAIIYQVQPNSPAELAKIPSQVAITAITVGDRKTQVDSLVQVRQLAYDNLGKDIIVHTTGPCANNTCGSEVATYQATLRTADQIGEKQGALGVEFEQDYLQFFPWYEMPFRGAAYGLKQAVSLGGAIVLALGHMVSDLFSRGVVPNQVAGPVGIVHEASQSGILTKGPLSVLLFAGMLSINLAIMNILPIPALDGGRAFFLILESALGKKHISRIEGYANYGGYFLLLGLILAVTARDVLKIVGVI